MSDTASISMGSSAGAGASSGSAGSPELGSSAKGIDSWKEMHKNVPEGNYHFYKDEMSNVFVKFMPMTFLQLRGINKVLLRLMRGEHGQMWQCTRAWNEIPRDHA